MTRVTSRRARTGQMMLTIVPDLDTDDRAPWEGCVTGSLLDEVAPTPVTDMVGPTGRPLYRRGVLMLDVAATILLATPDAAAREAILREFSTMQLRALTAKLTDWYYRRAVDVPRDFDGALTAAATALTTHPDLAGMPRSMP